MAKLNELFPKEKGQIEMNDVSGIKKPLTISNTELSGETKKSLWISFENYSLKYKLNKKAIIALCRHFEIDDTDDLEGKEISFIVDDDDKVAIREITPTKGKPKEKKK